MTTEEMLKDYILSRYKSIREFTIMAEIPYTTVKSILDRGVGNSSVNNVIKICKALHISADALADGKIVSRYEDSPDPVSDIQDIVNDTKDRLSNGDHLVINGKPVDIEYVEPIIDALDIGFEMVRRKSEKENHNKNHNKTITESAKITESN
jgi:hypothetical protein